MKNGGSFPFSRFVIAIAIAGLVSSSSALSQTAQQTQEFAQRPKSVWVEVTKPMLACGTVNIEPGIDQLLLDTLIRPPPDGSLPEDCFSMEVGDVFLLDSEQTEKDTQIIVKMWAPVCPQGCLPTMTPVFSPPRRLVGAYLRPRPAPEGWQDF